MKRLLMGLIVSGVLLFPLTLLGAGVWMLTHAEALPNRAQHAAARARWDAQGITHYRLTVRVVLYGSDLGSFEALVQEGVLVSVSGAPPLASDYFTVEALFARALAAIERPSFIGLMNYTARYEGLRYDDTFGYVSILRLTCYSHFGGLHPNCGFAVEVLRLDVLARGE